MPCCRRCCFMASCPEIPSAPVVSIEAFCSAFCSAANRGEQLLKVSLNRPVTFATRRFQSLPVENLQLAPAVANQTRPLETDRGHGNAVSMSPQHLRKKLVRDLKLIGLHAV